MYHRYYTRIIPAAVHHVFAPHYRHTSYTSTANSYAIIWYAVINRLGVRFGAYIYEASGYPYVVPIDINISSM